MAKLGGGLANQMRALGYEVKPPSDPSDGTCWEVHPPHSDTILLAKDQAEGWEKADQHWHQQNLAKMVVKPRADAPEAAAELTRLQSRIELLEKALEPFARISVPDELLHRGIVIDDDRIVSIEMLFAPHEQTVDEHGGKALGLCLSLDGTTVGDFRRAKAALSGSKPA